MNAVVPVTRLFTVAMGAVLCFGVLVPIALRRHETGLAVAAGALYAAYLILNLVAWRRTLPRR